MRQSEMGDRVLDRISDGELRIILDFLEGFRHEQRDCDCYDCRLQRFVARRIERRRETVSQVTRE